MTEVWAWRVNRWAFKKFDGFFSAVGLMPAVQRFKERYRAYAGYRNYGTS